MDIIKKEKQLCDLILCTKKKQSDRDNNCSFLMQVFSQHNNVSMCGSVWLTN